MQWPLSQINILQRPPRPPPSLSSNLCASEIWSTCEIYLLACTSDFLISQPSIGCLTHHSTQSICIASLKNSIQFEHVASAMIQFPLHFHGNLEKGRTQTYELKMPPWNGSIVFFSYKKWLKENVLQAKNYSLKNKRFPPKRMLHLIFCYIFLLACWSWLHTKLWPFILWKQDGGYSLYWKVIRDCDLCTSSTSHKIDAS